MITKQYECPNCGKPLIFDENYNGYLCVDCNEYFAVEDVTKEDGEVNPQYLESYVEIQCKLCGKTTIVDKDYSYGVCPFCFNNLIDFNQRITDFNPEVIIEFKEDKNTFVSHIANTLNSSGCPADLLSGVKLDSLKGLYIPFFRYTVENTYRCFLETSEVNNRFGDDGFYFQEINFAERLNVLCDATGTIPNNAIDDFADYNYKKSKMYFPKLLGHGYYTMSKPDTHDKLWKNLKDVVYDYTKNEMNKYVGKTEEIKNLLLKCDVKNIVKKFYLLPVWVLETTYNGEQHFIYINGQTERVASDIDFPKSYKKSLFGKEKVEKFQVEQTDEMKIKYKRFDNGIDFHNEVRKYDSNSATKDQKIGALRTR